MMKRMLAMLLALAMILTLAPAAFAQDSQSTTVQAEEVSGYTRPETEEANGETRPEPAPYDPEELVTVIVELEDRPTLDSYVPDAGQMAGQSVAQYLAEDRVQAEARLLENQQAAVAQAIGAETGSQVKVAAQWTSLVNAMAVEIPYGQLEAVQAMDGVKRAYVEHVYDRPVEELGEIDGAYGYSYNMVNLAPAWDAGYTGQGMLVAVLDTGLDLTYTSWGMSGSLETGVRRVHEAFTDNSFRNDPDDPEDGWTLRYTDETMRLFLQATQLNATTGASGNHMTYENNALYKNRKVPFACDYADGDLNVQPLDSDHGTHVAGTVAGYAATGEGEVIFSGVAPDAQILAMKVFPDADGGATESAILNALEDAAALGADVVNLSLGSDNGYAEDGTLAGEVYARLNATGIVFSTSAGNSGNSAASNSYGGYNLTTDPEISMISSPSVYATNLSVASLENTVGAQSVLWWNDGEDHKAAFLDSTGVAMKYKFVGAEPVNVIPLDGYGTYDDYYNAGFRSYYGYGDRGVEGIALIKRGGDISFADKINNAMNFTWYYYDASQGTYVSDRPVKAVIIYDEDPNATELILMQTDNTSLTSAFMSGQDGAALAEAAKAAVAAGTYVTLTVQEEDEIIPSETGGQMSSFSSWGAGPSLELKPEITAPGGNVWSAIVDQTYSPADPSGSYDDYTGSYGMMSGTSMAAPHITGLTALVEQYIQETLGITAKQAVGTLAQQLLVSTALPQADPSGVYYSPRLQGAGLVNVAGAVSTPAYISVDGQNVGKLELKDDPEREGSYTLTFNVNNLTAEALQYQAKAVLLRPDTGTVESQWGEQEVMLDSDVLLREVDLGTVTVPASGRITVSQTVTLTAEEKALLDETFPNGIYVEGFVILTDAQGANPQIGLPFLAFYGDWTAAPIFDNALWIDAPEDGQDVMNNASTWGVSSVAFYDGYNFSDLGRNPFGDITQPEYHGENITLSPGGSYMSVINDFVLYQLREAKLVVVEAKDAETGELYYRDSSAYQEKTYYNASYGMAIPSSVQHFTITTWRGTDLAGNFLPNGTECVFTITAYGDGEYPMVYDSASEGYVPDFTAIIPGENEPTFNGHAMDMTGDVISFPVLIDSDAPTLENGAATLSVRDGRTYLSGTFTDGGSLASVTVYPQVMRTYKEGYGDPAYSEYGLDYNNPFYAELIYDPDVQAWYFETDVTEYAHTNESYQGENNIYDFTWTGNVFIYGGDYGGNERGYAVHVDTTPGIVLSTTSALLYVGNSFDLSVNNNTGSDAALTRTSSNPEVATIDEFGHVVALAPGQTVITVSNGESSADCVVAVREQVTQVEDFKLSIESFSGLKPGGSLVVQVTDLQPAGVELTDIRWEVVEDDPELYQGLVNCAQYTTDGLSGEIYLNYSAYGSNPPIPGASGTLTVTLNGVSRQMHFDWEDLYENRDDDDLISDLYGSQQTEYVTTGETATLIAKYNDPSAHSFCPVGLYTLEGYVDNSYDNTTDPAKGLVLDGPAFCGINGTWTGKLVNQAGYALPETIRVFTRYESGYEYEMANSWRTDFTYNKETGEVTVYFTPTTSTSELVIRADGVSAPGNPAGETSGEEFEQPEGLYGPFDWEVVSGSGTLTTEENVTVNNVTKNVAYYVPSEPGVSTIKATSKDGRYSLNFAVVALPVQPDSLALDTNRTTVSVADTFALTATLSPEPSLPMYGEIIWRSYNPEVATVDENGTVTALSGGYAYITATAKYTGATDYCVVEVTPCLHEQVTTSTVPATCTEDGSVTVTCDVCGQVLSTEILPKGHQYASVVTEPTCTQPGYTTYTCTVCGDSYTADSVPALGHDYLTQVVPATETQEGYTAYTCQRCGYAYRDTITPVVECPSAQFTDLDTNQWYHESVDFVLNQGLMVGMSDTTFQPGGSLTRAQVVTILYRLAGEPKVAFDQPFTDVKEGHYFAGAVAWAYQAGITQGVTETAFAPNRPVTREQLATFLARYAESTGVEITGTLDGTFPDAGSVSSYARSAMAWAVSTGIINGLDGKLAPRQGATRAQAAAMFYRFCS